MENGTEQKIKKCIKCENQFPETLEYFYWSKRDQIFHRLCKKCTYLHSKIYIKNNYDKYQKIRAQYRINNRKNLAVKAQKIRRNNPARALLLAAKRRSKMKNLEFNLNFEDIEIPEFCPVFNIPLYISDGGKTDNSPSLERIDNDKGYTKTNTIVVSWKANRMKNNSSIDDLNKLVAFYNKL